MCDPVNAVTSVDDRPAASLEVPKMLSRTFRNPLLWSPVLATLLQLLVTGLAIAGTNGGDFPMRR